MIALILSASAFEVADGTWAWHEDGVAYGFEFNPEGFPAELGSASEIEAAFLEGMNLWNGIADVEVRYGGLSDLDAAVEGHHAPREHHDAIPWRDRRDRDLDLGAIGEDPRGQWWIYGLGLGAPREAVLGTPLQLVAREHNGRA